MGFNLFAFKVRIRKRQERAKPAFYQRLPRPFWAKARLRLPQTFEVLVARLGAVGCCSGRLEVVGGWSDAFVASANVTSCGDGGNLASFEHSAKRPRLLLAELALVAAPPSVEAVALILILYAVLFVAVHGDRDPKNERLFHFPRQASCGAGAFVAA